jgi:hypothetical protein
MRGMTHIIRQHNGSVLDHIGWGVPNFAAGVEALAAMTGVRPVLLYEPEGDERPFRNAVLHLGGAQHLEVIGPSPDYAGELKGIGAFTASLPAPALIYWYVGSGDLDAVAAQARAAGYNFQMFDDIPGDGSNFRRGAIGGYQHLPAVPLVVEWHRETQPDGRWRADLGASCALVEFRVEHPEPEGVRAMYAALGIDQAVEWGTRPRLSLTLDTPKGRVRL